MIPVLSVFIHPILAVLGSRLCRCETSTKNSDSVVSPLADKVLTAVFHTSPVTCGHDLLHSQETTFASICVMLYDHNVTRLK